MRFLVEGHLEKFFLQEICPGSRVQKVVPNGKNVSAQVIVKHLITHIRMGFRANDDVIIICDREGRSESADKLRDSIYEELKSSHGIEKDSIQIFIADRMIENWIVAGKYPEEKKIDGINGKSIMKQKVKGYNETTDGVRLLKSCIPKEIAKKSKSFKKLLDSMCTINCWWLAKESK